MLCGLGCACCSRPRCSGCAGRCRRALCRVPRRHGDCVGKTAGGTPAGSCAQLRRASVCQGWRRSWGCPCRRSGARRGAAGGARGAGRGAASRCCDCSARCRSWERSACALPTRSSHRGNTGICWRRNIRWGAGGHRVSDWCKASVPGARTWQSRLARRDARRIGLRIRVRRAEVQVRVACGRQEGFVLQPERRAGNLAESGRISTRSLISYLNCVPETRREWGIVSPFQYRNERGEVLAGGIIPHRPGGASRGGGERLASVAPLPSPAAPRRLGILHPRERILVFGDNQNCP